MAKRTALNPTHTKHLRMPSNVLNVLPTNYRKRSSSPSRQASKDAEPQVFPHQAEACQSAEAEPSHPAMDPSPNWEHH
ncbi:hypothetical protein VTN49DRAFT_1435 [Thermomyces lanuginosus]|uniref:uncharacterized protein n=1 Tax=Thermomyces lanuginosus TaxID=5541 RepID=UPI00374377FE